MNPSSTPTKPDPDAGRVFMKELASRINRRPATVRSWERMGVLPKKLLPKRSPRGWRYWTEAQVQGILAWMVSADMRPGKGLPHYNPSPDQISAHLEGQRAPRKREPIAA